MRDPHTSTKRPQATRLLAVLLAAGGLALAAAPGVAAHSTDCAPGSGGLGGMAGTVYGSASAWSCAGVTYHRDDGDTTVTLSALSYDTALTI